MDGREIKILLKKEWMRGGARSFVYGWAMQFLKKSEPLYRAFFNSVALEHYAVEQIQSFLSSRWAPMSNAIGRKDIILVCLSNEYNLLALHMAATMAVLAELGVIFFGGDTPAADIAQLAGVHRVHKILVALCPASDIRKSINDVNMLRHLCKDTVDIAVGGNASFQNISGVVNVRSFEQMEQWMHNKLR